MNRIMLIAALLPVAAIARSGGAGSEVQPSEPPPASVIVEPAQLRPLEQWRQVTGELRASRRADLAVEEQGLVVQVAVRQGDVVEAGRLLVALDEIRASIAVAGAKADRDAMSAIVEQRLAELDLARADEERWLRAEQQRSAAPAELDESRTRVRSAEALLAQARADLVAAKADLELAERRLADMTIEAPFAGRVVSRHVEVGEWVSEGDAIVELLALDPIEVWLDVPERYVHRLSGSTESVRVRIVPLDEERQARSAVVIPTADPRSRLFPVRAVLDNEDERLKPGLTIVGLVPTGRVEPTLTVHKDAIRRDDAGGFVYFDADGVAAVARIEPLFAVGDRVAIARGALPPGAPVVVEGNERLYPGQPLTSTPRGKAAGDDGAGRDADHASQSTGEGQ